MYKRNINGSSTVPCGTPDSGQEEIPRINTLGFRKTIHPSWWRADCGPD